MRLVKGDHEIGLTIDGSFKDHIICRVRAAFTEILCALLLGR